ncbi:MAG: hypothetical protein IPK77_14125 [Cellvibrio sp.]|nr:hypothetical protein [Cellvibrio sp.]
MRYISIVACILFLSACASYPHKKTVYFSSPELDKALTGEAIFHRVVDGKELPELELFALTDEMKEFATHTTKKARNQDEQAELLHNALMKSSERGGRGIRYRVEGTGSAAEVFKTNTANCLGYTLLYVAMARHIGLNAKVNQVLIPPTWYRGDSDAYFLMKHVNAKVKLRQFSTKTLLTGGVQVADVSDVVVDLEMRRYRSAYSQQLLDDIAVEALFYNNKAMEFLEKENYQQSFLFLRRALRSNNESFIWSNLGTLYWRLGELSLAEAVYQKALSFNTEDLSVLHNLAVLYEKMERFEDASLYREKVKSYRAANPYYLYQLAKKAKAHQDLPLATKWIESALKKQNKDDRLFLLAAEVYELNGYSNKAKKMRRKAEALQLQNKSG